MINEKGNINNGFTGGSENNPFEEFGVSKKNPFSVPEGYFDTLPGQIREKISAEPITGSYRSFLKWKFQPAFSIAAVSAFVILIVVAIFINGGQGKNGFPDLTVEQVLSEEPGIIEYTNDHLLFDMLYSMSESEIDDILTTENGFETELTEEEIYNYLTDEELSSELFYNL